MITVALNSKVFRRKLFWSTAIPIFLGLMISCIFVALIMNLVSENRRVEHADQVIAKANHALQLVIDGETGLRGFALSGKEHFLEPYQNSAEIWAQEVETLAELIPRQTGQRVRLRQIDEAYKKWKVFAEEIIDLKRNGSEVEPVISRGVGKRQMDQIRSLLGQFIDAEESLRDNRNRETKSYVRLTLLSVAMGTLIIGLFLAWFTRSQLSSVSSTFTDALQKELLQRKKLEEQAWFRTGQSLLAEQTRGVLLEREVAEGALTFLAKYLRAEIGTLYMVNGEGLEFLAGHSLPDPLALKGKKILWGQGILGQMRDAKQARIVQDLPANYLTITSSLGASGPTSVLVAPLLAEGELKGILELGFLHPVEEKEKDFAEMVAETIGVALASAQYRTRLRELLEESQRLSEELQAQQEELRVSNEELAQQAKMLKESQAKLEGQQAELEQTNFQLNQQAELLGKQNDELGRARHALETKALDLQRSSEYKSQFLANMSHELRTPLNSTLILAQLLMENKGQKLSPEEVEYARTILSSSNDLLHLINDILDLAKVEAGKIELHREEVSLPELMNGLDRSFQQVAQQKNLLLHFDKKGNARDNVSTDRLRLEQILRNLISNAIKFTKEGKVSVEWSSPTPETTQIKVKDTGIGIPEDKIAFIFEAFQQGDGTTSRQFGGTGLGLTISRDLAKLLGGGITVESELGSGSTFTLTIRNLSPSLPAEQVIELKPSAPVKTAPPEAKPSRPTRKLPFTDDRGRLTELSRILLLVEDDLAFAKILLDIGRESGFHCLVAQTAEEAVTLADQFFPHAIILDMQLPDHNGLFVLDRLKENTSTRHIPIHIISAHDFSPAALQMGAIGYLVKPADREKLINVVKKLEEKLSQDFKKVLVVEDNAVQRESLKKLIAHDKVEVKAVGRGHEALELLHHTTFDCLVLDLSLPDMSGFELLETMAAADDLSYPPTIVYTGRNLSSDEEQRLQRYSQSIILKGAKSPERLLSEVGLFLHQIESHLPPERQKVLRELRDRERDLENKTILVVDDDVRNVFALSNALERRGARVLIARNGKESLQRLQENPGIGLVVMDIMMPEMDGFEAMRLIRRESRWAKLPIIAVTAKAMADDQEKCLQAGASDYLSKPIDLSKLLSLIRVWLHPAGGPSL